MHRWTRCSPRKRPRERFHRARVAILRRDSVLTMGDLPGHRRGSGRSPLGRRMVARARVAPACAADNGHRQGADLKMAQTEPRPALLPDMPLSQLDVAEFFVVTLMRLWQGTVSQPACAYPDWRAGAQAQVDEVGACGFDALCRILTASVTRTLDVRPLGCTCLGADERAVLQTVAYLQRGEIEDAKAILSALFPLSAARCAIEPAWIFATLLASRELCFPCRSVAFISTATHSARRLDPVRPRRHRTH
jgi:hypothetical protein